MFDKNLKKLQITAKAITTKTAEKSDSDHADYRNIDHKIKPKKSSVQLL
jgi:hypothetical protein